MFNFLGKNNGKIKEDENFITFTGKYAEAFGEFMEEKKEEMKNKIFSKYIKLEF